MCFRDGLRLKLFCLILIPEAEIISSNSNFYQFCAARLPTNATNFVASFIFM